VNVKTRKKLIEVALPLEAVNIASAREKSIRHGHPSTLHLWWARRPAAAARAVIFAQIVDDPSAWPERFPTEAEQDTERERLFRIIENLVRWENSTNEDVLEAARAEIRRSWRDTCEDNKDQPAADELFDPAVLPSFHDPFAGGGALPLEAQRLGLVSFASDLNPVAVLINKAMIEIPYTFAGQAPVNPGVEGRKPLAAQASRGAAGLADDVRYYGDWLRQEAEARIGQFYPTVEITAEMTADRPDLEPLVGRTLTSIAWLWTRTVKSPNPAFSGVDVPLASSFLLASKPGKEVYVEPVVEGGDYRFTIKVGKPDDLTAVKNGTKTARGANFRCLMSGAPMTGDYIKGEGKVGRMGARLMAIVAEGDRGRIYLPPTRSQEIAATEMHAAWRPEFTISGSTQYLGVKPYGIERFDQLFTERQLVALSTFSALVEEARKRIEADAIGAGLSTDSAPLDGGGKGAAAYADAVCVYLAFALDKSAVYWNSLCPWLNQPKNEIVGNSFGRQAIPMVWDYAEANPFSASGGNIQRQVDYVAKAIVLGASAARVGVARQLDARVQKLSESKIVSTDPPYFDNVPYADLSDFFYVWLRRSLRFVFPELFATLVVPKSEELVAFAYRHHSKSSAEKFFLDGMTLAMCRVAEGAHPAFPVSIYYAFKQSESDHDDTTTSTGWETFLDAVRQSGLSITGTWPIRTERPGRLRETGSNALASSVVLICRRSDPGAPLATRREFVAALKSELPSALAQLQHGNIAPVDLAQSAIGPGMAIYTRYARVVDADGSNLSVRAALAIINQALDEVLAEQDADYDADTRWAVAWFDQYGFGEGEFGVAETLAKAKNTSVRGMVEAGIMVADRGRVRLLRPRELPADWDPSRDSRLTVWEATHHLVRVLDEGEQIAGELARPLGGIADAARELAYRLYVVCERRARAQDALLYNALVQSWPEIQRLAAEDRATSVQGTLGV
jgi:putative DNA methylase